MGVKCSFFATLAFLECRTDKLFSSFLFPLSVLCSKVYSPVKDAVSLRLMAWTHLILEVLLTPTRGSGCVEPSLLRVDLDATVEKQGPQPAYQNT